MATLDVKRVAEGVMRVEMVRPEVLNAFDEAMIADLEAAFTAAADNAEVRCVLLSGTGRAFCAGADIEWMAQTVHYTRQQNLEDAIAVARMLAALDGLPVPLVGRVQGAALGGGAGLAAVCDVVVAEDRAVFGFTEVKLGILPAVISPFTIAKIGRGAARELFLTGARFPAARAREIGLVHAVVPESELDATIAAYVREFLSAGPEAIAAAKALIRDVWGRSVEDARPISASALAARRVSAEGQEGLTAFLEKRKPSWG